MDSDTKIKNSNHLNSEEFSGKILFFGILLSYLVVCAISIVGAIKWIKSPFPGFLLHKSMTLASTGQYHWTGIQAGIKYPDKVIGINGKSVSSPQDLKEIINKSQIGDSITYTFKRGDQIIEATVRTMRFTYTDLIATFGSYFIASLAYILIGLTVYLMKPNIHVSRAFLTACFFLSLYAISVFDWVSNHNLTWIYMLSIAFVPGSLIYFSFYFPEPLNFTRKHPRLQLLPYVLSLILGVPLTLFYPDVRVRIFYHLILLYMAVGAPLLLFPIVKSYFKPTSAIARQRAKVVLIGAALTFPIPALAFYTQIVYGSFLGIRFQTNFLILPLLIFPASIAYAIARHNLFDVDVYIKRAVGYVFMTAIIIGAYALISIPLNIALGEYEIARSRAFPILFTLVVILVFNPLYHRVQSFVDRVFFRKEYDYGAVVDKVGNAITSMLDLPAILKELVTTFTKDLFIDTSSVMLLTPEGAHFKVFLADGEDSQKVENVNIDRKAPLIGIIEQEKAELTKFDVLEDPKYREISQECATGFEALNASLMVPLIYQDKVIGLLSLGEKKSGKFYTREDVNLIKTLAGQGAVAIENARMVEEVIEKERMEEELSIARDLQVSMLPAECPQIKGIEIAAFSVSAREVGGDFYDFIEMGEDKAGFVIGDVTGKSVSGALVMSASRSVFRMLSEIELTVAESMIRANRRLKKDVKTGMFVALLYAVLNGRDKSVSLCSAGQTQPVYLSAEKGEASLVETMGDTFPLGILDDANYEETRLELAVGDKMIFYTDGIVEAMNEQEKMFGFERLLEIVQKSKSTTADALLQEIIDTVKAFTGTAPQHDDLTVIVIKVTDG